MSTRRREAKSGASRVRLDLLGRVAGMVPRPVGEDCVRVGVDGVDGAGKTVFADELADVLRDGGRPVVRVSVDDFHNPLAVRYRRGRTSPEGFWVDAFDYARLTADVLDPLEPGGSRRYRPAAHDLVRDVALDPAYEIAPGGAVLVVDGLFLHRDELAEVWDFSIFLDVPFDVARRRMVARDGTSPGSADAAAQRYVGAQRLYFAACAPRKRASVVIDNTRLDAPRLADAERSSLRADCSRCVGLCCVAPAFSASADFAIDKPAGHPCPNLQVDFRCGIHDRLRDRGFRGCAGYDCFGAGQQVSQVTFGGRDWRAEPQLAKAMFDTFAVMRQLHELLWYLTEAVSLPVAAPLHADLRRAVDDTERLTREPSDDLLGFDVAAFRDRVIALLVGVSELARAATGGPMADHRGADLVGADLRGADLRGAGLRGATLIAADLRRADLSGADFLGADLRDADIRGADLTGSIFLVQSQIDSANGDSQTRLPTSLVRPSHWSGAG